MSYKLDFRALLLGVNTFRGNMAMPVQEDYKKHAFHVKMMCDDALGKL